jgi:hypothetical protein
MADAWRVGRLRASRGERVQALRKGVWDLFSEPESSSAAVCMSFFILFLILLSSTTFCLETMAEFHTPNAEAAFYVIELICIAAFSIEYVLRLLCCPKCVVAYFAWRFPREGKWLRVSCPRTQSVLDPSFVGVPRAA